MDGESRLKPILNHLAWLADRIDDPVNDGRLKDAALLTYNAAAMLQWRFVFPVSDLDTIVAPEARNEAARLIDSLVKTARRTVTQAKEHPAEDERIRRGLVRAISKVVAKLPGVLLVGHPTPMWMPELQSAPDLVALVDEFLDAHRDDYGWAIAKGKASVDTQRTGPAAAIQEAIAWLGYVHSPEYAAAGAPEEHSVLARLTAGYLKTAVELPPESDVPTAGRRGLRDLAQSLVEQAAEGGDA